MNDNDFYYAVTERDTFFSNKFSSNLFMSLLPEKLANVLSELTNLIVNPL